MQAKTILIALGLCLGAQRGALAQDPLGVPDQVFRVTSELVVLCGHTGYNGALKQSGRFIT